MGVYASHMDNTTPARTVKLNDIVELKDGKHVRIIRITTKRVWLQEDSQVLLLNVPAWMNAFTSMPVAKFANSMKN